MPQSEAQDTTTRIINAVTGFLQRHRLMLIGILAAVVVIVVGMFIFLEVRSSRDEAARVAAEEVQELYDQWVETTDEEERSALATRIQNEVDRVVADYPRFYAAQRALMVRADLHWELERWLDAANDFERAADGFRDSYLTPIALFNAAAATEQAGEMSRSAELLQQLIDNYDSEEVPRALFALGRLAEARSDAEDALGFYNRLVDDHSGSNWTNLARNRIIVLSIGD